MFDNIGVKIKMVAEIGCWIGIICFAILALAIWISADAFLLGLFVFVVGALSSWLGSFITYGFGELIENSQQSELNQQALIQLLKDLKDQQNQSAPAAPRSATPAPPVASPVAAPVTPEPSPAAPHTRRARSVQTEMWCCSNCGAYNHSSRAVCCDCGLKR